MRRVLTVLALLLGLSVAAGAALLALAHRGIDALDPALPDPERILGAGERADLPMRLRFVNTASQRTPRSQVLDPTRDPTPDAEYVMGHVSFVLEWADGRIFLIDVGLDRAAALDFGRPLEWVGADPIRPLTDTAEALSDAAGRVRGVAFTHLHVDHVAGIDALCRAVGGPIRLFQTALQAGPGNHTTRPGVRRLADAGCLEPEILPETPLAEIPGFPGLAAIRAAGHTPGSTLFAVHVREPGARRPRSWILAGDVVNAADGIRHDVPKPWLYSLLVVPESGARLARLRGYLRDLDRERGVVPLVSHDQLALEASGLDAW